jgi:S-DNA-T family DNA segregation ATPase FtsK/SpoIIIE
MASQVDSRTIIDIAGAEKLIGRGDMLYAPVGFAKPVRVQGSFVSEDEIEKIIDFIKTNSGVSSYDSSVIESIEREAAKCGEGKNKGYDEDSDGGDSDGDPLFRAAVELAIESGKISTSLLQRRLSVGYGRAAKLIDKMEQKGIVSAPEGQKPRTVLISRQDFMEMSFKQED